MFSKILAPAVSYSEIREKIKYVCMYVCMYLTVIVRKRVQYRRIVSRRGRRPSWLKSGDITQA